MLDFQTEAPAVQDGPQRLALRATGSEYFRIWIVNVLLTIVTLGIYSAWAKVRREQYFHSSTVLAGSSFDYHGNPMAILKGRIVALLLVGGYNVAFRFSLTAGAVMFVLLAAVMPWLLWRSMQFRLYNTSYRGIRFGFGGSAGQAYLHFLLLPLLAMLTFGLAAPYVHKRIRSFQFNQARYGNTGFACDASTGLFYKVWGLAVAATLGLLIVLGVVAGVLTAIIRPDAGSAAGLVTWLPIALGLPYYLFVFAAMQFAHAKLANGLWGATTLGGQRFVSDMRWTRMTSILLTNALAVVCTLGLFLPFAVVRMRKYRIESMQVLADGSLDGFVAGVQQEVDATGDGAADLLDFDLSL